MCTRSCALLLAAALQVLATSTMEPPREAPTRIPERGGTGAGPPGDLANRPVSVGSTMGQRVRAAPGFKVKAWPYRGFPRAEVLSESITRQRPVSSCSRHSRSDARRTRCT